MLKKIENLSRAARNRLSILFLVLAGLALTRFVLQYQVLVVQRQVAQQQSQIYETILENDDFAVIATDNRGKVTVWNPAAAKLFGWTREEMIGQDMFRILPDQLVEMHKKIFADHEKRKDEYVMHNVRCVTLTKDKKPIDVLVSIRTIPVGHTCRMLVAIDSPALRATHEAAERTARSMDNARILPLPVPVTQDARAE